MWDSIISIVLNIIIAVGVILQMIKINKDKKVSGDNVTVSATEYTQLRDFGIVVIIILSTSTIIQVLSLIMKKPMGHPGW